MGLIKEKELDFRKVAIALCTKFKKVSPCDRFVFYLGEFLKESYGVGGASYSQPDLDIFVNASANTYQKETNNIYGAVELSPVKSRKKEGARKTAIMRYEPKEMQHWSREPLFQLGDSA
ncbi:hypothetical protein [Kamptonema sp. UHCC 0994]|uniref:hypothetical protein n=1 Tax=Kamptonema sp. UHCC 0994 TaxID=3031329 RepID=UPI0023B8C8B7|nr:hypothetical protein [Kamptonema sp. UHCC 0994]MDF0554896.1 hypothetical protein [Kamptonema sp. UHCC 0994]